MIGYKDIGMNVIARMDLLSPSDELKNALLNFSSDYVNDDGKINLESPIIKGKNYAIKLSAAGGDINWYTHLGKRFGSFLKIRI